MDSLSPVSCSIYRACCQVAGQIPRTEISTLVKIKIMGLRGAKVCNFAVSYILDQSVVSVLRDPFTLKIRGSIVLRKKLPTLHAA